MSRPALWHWTTLAGLAGIVRDGQIDARSERFSVEGVPVVWLTTDPTNDFWLVTDAPELLRHTVLLGIDDADVRTRQFSFTPDMLDACPDPALAEQWCVSLEPIPFEHVRAILVQEGDQCVRYGSATYVNEELRLTA